MTGKKTFRFWNDVLTRESPRVQIGSTRRVVQRGSTRRVVVILVLMVWGIGMWGAGSKKILVVYYSMTGNTKQMAEAAAEGARSVKGVTVKLVSVKDARVSDAVEADGIILGSPVYNANMAIPMLKFIKRWPFKNTPMKDKIGAAFVTAGGISAGEELAMMSILHTMLMYRMIVVGGSEWQSAFGASAVTEEGPFDTALKKKGVDPYFLKKAKGLGTRVAEVVIRFHE